MSRKAAREKAMQALYQLDSQSNDLDKQIENFIKVRIINDADTTTNELDAVQSVFDIDSSNEVALAKAKQAETDREDLESGIIVELNEANLKFFKDLVYNVWERKDELDEIYSKHLKKWTLDRLPKLEKILLRIGTYEILFNDEVPDSVAINEIVELSHMYVDDKSYSYINAVLGKISDSKNS